MYWEFQRGASYIFEVQAAMIGYSKSIFFKLYLSNKLLNDESNNEIVLF